MAKMESKLHISLEEIKDIIERKYNITIVRISVDQTSKKLICEIDDKTGGTNEEEKQKTRILDY